MPPIEETVGFAIARLCKEHRTAVGVVLAELGVHVGQEMLLQQLWSKEGLTQSQLAEHLCAEPPTVTKMLQRMEQAGLIERRADPEDARMSRVFLTDQGRALQAPIEHCWSIVEGRVTAGMTSEERLLLRRLLVQARHNLL